MQIVQKSATPGSESAARPSNSNVLNYQRTPVPPKREQGDRKSVPEVNRDGLVKSPYLLLLSRLEAMLGQRRSDEESLAQLRVMLAERIRVISKESRQGIQDLPEFRATGAASAEQLPQVIDGMLRSASLAAGGLALLKHPLFVGHMNRGDRSVFYGPQGMLRAS
ncbi:MAG: hypothetical protein HY342_08960 [Candidatus Lambdaproteobacteria bacterium]|nr:hypothetical protein [Candidatus Lambdaproteobacteria bacterium]